MPSLAFDVRLSHLAYRPVEIWEMATRSAAAEEFSPAPSPTYAIPLPDPLIADPSSLNRYEVFAAPRPWWACEWFLPPRERPVDLRLSLIGFSGMALAGLVLMFAGYRQEAVA